MTRAERRRLEREIAATPPIEGLGLGWRRTTGRAKRRYPVREPGPVDLDRLNADSDAARARLGLDGIDGIDDLDEVAA